MSTIIYKCDTCNKITEQIDNKYGITNFGDCIITKGCKGHLLPIKKNLYSGRKSLITREEIDFIERDVFFRYVQKIPENEWTIRQKFYDSFIVYVYDSSGNVIDQSKYFIKKTNDYNRFSIKFIDGGLYSGEVHIISRYGNGFKNEPDPIKNEYPVQISWNGVLTLAVPKYVSSYAEGDTIPPSTPQQNVIDISNNTIKIEIELIRPNQTAIICTETLLKTNKLSSWNDVKEIFVRNRKEYVLRQLEFKKMKVFINFNSNNTEIQDGTVLKINRIDYGDGVFHKIPRRGLLILLSDTNNQKVVYKNKNKMLDCGEIANNDLVKLIYRDQELTVNNNQIEKCIPEIKIKKV